MKFKVGDKVKWNKSRKITALDNKKVYIINKISDRGYLDFEGRGGEGWFPENFELCKNSIVKDIIKDL